MEMWMSDQRMDKELKELLEGLNPKFNPDHWQALSSRLDGLDANIEEAFDYNASDALQDISPQYNPSHWAMFESTLEKDNGIEAQAFDTKVAKELTQMHIPYNPAHWRRLEILRAERLKRKVHITALRLAECALLILLWWGSPMLFDDAPATHTAAQSAFAQTHPDAQSNESDVNTGIEKVDLLTDMPDNNLVYENEAIIVYEGAETPAIPALSPPMVNTIHPLKQNPIDLNAKNISIALRENHQPADELTHTAQVSDPAGVDALESLPSQGNELLAYDGTTFVLTAKEIPTLKNVLEKKYVSISPYISADFNAINSHPGIQVLDESELKFLTLTPGLGIDIGFHNEPWAVKTGLGYGYKFYDPNISEQFGSIHGYQELNFNKVAMHVLEIPVRLHFDVLKGLRHSLYVVAGSSLHYIVRQEYDKPRRSLEFDLGGQEKVYSRIQPLLEDNKYESGNFLVGFSEASYITADIGIGFERKLSNDLAIYVQPTYQRMFGPGVGPNYDVINTFSLQVGLRL
jgi:hypothetical protein